MLDKYDVIIIGAGMGGLMAGNLLVKKGKKVLILEQHNLPGGYLCGFKRKGFYFDGGGQSFGSYGILFPLLKEIGMYQKIEFNRVFYRLLTPKIDVAINSLLDLQKAFMTSYPESTAEIESFFSELKQLIDVMLVISIEPAMPLLGTFDKLKRVFGYVFTKALRKKFELLKKYQDVKYPDFVAAHFQKNQELQDFFSNICYKNASVQNYAGMWYSFIYDYYYPEMGLQDMMNKLAENFQQNKGDILYNTKISQILSQNNNVSGVMTDKGERLFAEYVVYAGDYLKLYKDLLGQELPGQQEMDILGLPLKELNKPAKVSESFVNLYLGLDLLAEKLDELLKVHHLMFYQGNNYNLNHNDLDYFKKTSLEITNTTYQNPNLTNKGKASLVVQAMAPYGWMDRWATKDIQKRSKEYYLLKDKVTADLLENIKVIIPDIEGLIEVAELATPLTMERYTLNSFGASAGWSWDPEVSPIKSNQQQLETAINNLYTCGHWTVSPGGVPSAALSAKMVSELI